MTGRLKAGEPVFLAARSWPLDDPLLAVTGGDPGLVPHFQEVLTAFNRLKAEHGVDPGKKIDGFCTVLALAPFAEGFKGIARLSSVTFLDGDLGTPTRAVTVVKGGAVALELAGLKDPAAEKAKLEKERDKLIQEIASLDLRLSDASFTTKAPEAAVAKMRGHAEEKRARLEQLKGLL
jgi:valyl-tRNA synthetase